MIREVGQLKGAGEGKLVTLWESQDSLRCWGAQIFAWFSEISTAEQYLAADIIRGIYTEICVTGTWKIEH
jgi:hypothetical protein